MTTHRILLEHDDVALFVGDALDVLREMPDGSAASCVTSPPYLDAREDYPSPSLSEFFQIFCELERVLTGSMAWNVGRIWRERQEQLWWVDLIAVAKAAGWRHEDTRVWVKPNANPIRGELFVDNHEYVLFFSGPDREFYPDHVRVEYQPGSIARLRRRHVNHIGVKNDGNGAETSRHDRAASRGERHEPNPIGARPPSFMLASVGEEKGNLHPAPMPLRVADELVLVTSQPEEIVVDPFAGSGTTLLSARRHGRRALGIELSETYAQMAVERVSQLQLDITDFEATAVHPAQDVEVLALSLDLPPAG